METYQAVFKRKEVKYLLTEAQLAALRPALEAHMEPDAFAHSSIYNLYYDTPDYRLIRRSQEKPAYKEKLRLRSYGVPDEETQVFPEIKKKVRGIMAIFLAMTVGLCCGMGYCAMAVLAALVTCVILLLQGKQAADVRERDIRVTVPENLDYSTLFSDLFAAYTTSSKLLRVKTVNMGSLYSLHYRVTLKDTDKEKELLDAMRCRNGNLEISCGIAADGRQGEAL